MTAANNEPPFLFGNQKQAQEWCLRLSEGVPGHDSLFYRHRTGSTQDDALQAGVSGTKDGSVFLADFQSRGRGRRGGVWKAEQGTSLLFSLLLTPGPTVQECQRISLACGFCLSRVLTDVCQEQVGIKWPNDLYCKTGKLAGVLIETRGNLNNKERVVSIGIGVNVFQAASSFKDQLSGRAASIFSASGEKVDRKVLLKRLLFELKDLRELVSRGWEQVCQEVSRRLIWIGREVVVEGEIGVFKGIDREGSAVIVNRAGNEMPVFSGSMLLADSEA
jgi:BirA family transcriptional regulator, biotin operon repressor / biotin---[acetyl-CoA-carboxylase] ligase